MWFLWDFFHDYPLLFAAQAALTIWMFIDAYRRGVEPFWLWIILIFPFMGAWIYFFAVKLPTLRVPRQLGDKPLWQQKLSLAELQYRVERMPTVFNRVALSERLMEKQQHREAIPHLEAALALDETFCQAMHDLALCHIACRDPGKGLQVLDRLMKRDARWSDYRAWKTLIEAHDALGSPDEALKTCRDLEKRVPTWENKCRLAERLIDQGQKAEAATMLHHALEDHAFAPFKTRMRNWRWARHAHALVKEAEAK